MLTNNKNIMKKWMLRLFSLCSVVAVPSLYAQYENAAYIGLGSLSGGSSQRVLVYFDSSFNELGYVTLQTSAYDGANSIAYGASSIPNSNGFPGMLLQRDTPPENNNYFTVNAYADPLIAGLTGGAELPRSMPSNYGSIFVASSGTTDYIDRVVAINSTATDGYVVALVNRYNKEAYGGGYMSSYIYRYKIPATADAPFSAYRVDEWVDVGGEQVMVQAPRWDIPYTTVEVGGYKDFTTGYFFSPNDSEVTEQLAVLDANGLVQFFQVKDNKTNVISGYPSIDVSVDGRGIISIFGGDEYSLFVLYDNYEISEYDTRTQEVINTFFMSTSYPLLDMVNVSPAVVPEPAEYAALFGLLALCFAFFRRSRK